MVPMTSSLYVAGYLDDTSTLLVDIGTGYFVEKSLQESKEYFARKIAYVGEQMEKIAPILVEKQRTRTVVVDALSSKLSQQMAKMGTDDKQIAS